MKRNKKNPLRLGKVDCPCNTNSVGTTYFNNWLALLQDSLKNDCFKFMHKPKNKQSKGNPEQL